MHTIEYTDTTGKIVSVSFASLDEALKRLAYLNIQEMKTKLYAPTDCGNVRSNYLAEASAINSMLMALDPLKLDKQIA